MVNSTQGWQTHHPGKNSKPFWMFGACQNGALQPTGELGADEAISSRARCDREVAELLGG